MPSSLAMKALPFSIAGIILLVVASLQLMPWQTDALEFSSPLQASRIHMDMERISVKLDRMEERQSTFDTMERIVNDAAERAAREIGEAKEETLSKVCEQLWRMQQTNARAEVEQKKKAAAKPETSTAVKIDNSRRPNGNDIVVVSGTNKKYRESLPEGVYDQMVLNRQSYCDKHGYINMMVDLEDYVVKGKEDMSPYWLKVFALRDAFTKHPESKWLMWVDADAIIMDESRDLASHILAPEVIKEKTQYNTPIRSSGSKYKGNFTAPEEGFSPSVVEIIASQDLGGLNTGIFFLRRSQYIRKLIDDHWMTEANLKSKSKSPDQDTLIDLILASKETRSRVSLMHQSVFNAYYDGYELESSRWAEGDFIVHFPNHSSNAKYGADWKRYWELKKG